MLSISLLAMKLRGMRRSINISPLRGVLQPLTQSNQRDDFCSKALLHTQLNRLFLPLGIAFENIRRAFRDTSWGFAHTGCPRLSCEAR